MNDLPILPVKNEHVDVLYRFSSSHKHLVNTFISTPYSQKTKTQWKRFYNALHQAKKKAIQSKIQLQFKWLDSIPKGEKFHVIPTNIQHEINNKCQYFLQFSLQLPNRRFTVHICRDKKRIPFLRIEKILLWFHFVNPFIDSTCSNEVHVYFYDIGLKKQLPREISSPLPPGSASNVLSPILDTEHINTAFTFVSKQCSTETSIYIFRYEEFFKVLLHETCHNLGFDFLSLSDSILEKQNFKLLELFQLSPMDLRFNESYCELCARILNSMIYVLYNKSKIKQRKGKFSKTAKQLKIRPVQSRHLQTRYKKMIDQDYYLWRQVFAYEQLFSLIQCTKLLKYNHLRFEDLGNFEKGKLYRENTQGFSYFVLSSIFMFFLNDFFLWQSKFAKGSLNLAKTEECTNEYISIIQDKMNNKQYLEALTNIESSLEKEKNPVFLKSLRMSILSSLP
jgi:hypothetical protein